jgi:hypothetical protein
MHIHVVYQGPADNVIPVLEWCEEADISYYLTHLVQGNIASTHARETIEVQEYWNPDGEAVVHTWEQPEHPDAFRPFKQMTYAMNVASNARLQRDLVKPNTFDVVVWYNGYSLRGLPSANPFLSLDSLDDKAYLALKDDRKAQIGFNFFITRPHNFDKVSLLWKRQNQPISSIEGLTGARTVWWRWLRLVGLRLRKLGI